MSQQSPLIFDRDTVRRRRERAAPTLETYDFLLREVADRLAERLDDVRRSFPLALDLGCHNGALARALAGRGGIDTLVESDLSPAMVRAARGTPAEIARRVGVAADEEFLPFAERSFDLVLSAMNLHWVNDLPGALLQINTALKPDGLFLGAMLGGDTLHELRDALMIAESELEGGAGPRVSPFAQLQDMAGLLQRAGFALPVCDIDTITVIYPDALRLMEDVRGMGQANSLHVRRKTCSRRETILHAAELYHDAHADTDGRIPATFQVLFCTGWRPAADQPQPLRPGSARHRLADALNTTEILAGDKAAPNGGGQ